MLSEGLSAAGGKHLVVILSEAKNLASRTTDAYWMKRFRSPLC